MGPSGSGKTTLLNLIGGLDRPTEGEVNVAGERIDRLSGGALAKWRARHVGFVFQFYNLMPMLTAERNIELPLLLTSLSGAARRKNVRAALESWDSPIVPATSRANSPEGSSSALRLHAPSWLTQLCSCAMSQPEIWIAARRMKFSVSCKHSTRAAQDGDCRHP